MNNKKTKTPATTYVAVSHHIYFDGNSYRVRAIRSGVKHSKNFSSKRKAYTYRKQLLAQ